MPGYADARHSPGATNTGRATGGVVCCVLALVMSPDAAFSPVAGKLALLTEEPLEIIRVKQRALDVISERGRDVADGTGNPAEPGRRADRQQHPGDLLRGRARRQRPGGASFQADRRRADRHKHPYLYQRRGFRIQEPRRGEGKAEPRLICDGAFVDDRQPA